MKRTTLLPLLALAAGLTLQTAQAEFTAPSADRIAAAAVSPSVLIALLDDASPAQAAAVVKDVLLNLPKDLSPDAKGARIAAIIRQAFASQPQEQHPALAAALGNELGANPVFSVANKNSASVIAAVQREMVAIGTANQTNLGQAFAIAFGGAQGTRAQAALPLVQPSEIRRSEDVPQPPPVARTYDGQTR